ncbi:GTP 3',8-cyclase MoaA [bacterium]|nr:GTP 3',8-cyclase MoaA [bacterium]
MVDRFGRVITYIRVSVTDRCNLRCLYCMPEEGMPWFAGPDLLNFDEIARVLAVGARLGLRKIRITGGEPLVRPGVPELAARLAALPGVTALAMTTNGVLLAPHVEELYRAGVCSLNISLDTLQPARFMQMTRRDLFARVWEGIEKAAGLPFPKVKINVVLARGVNDDEILDFARLTRTHAFEVRFIEPMPFGPTAAWQEGRVVPAAEILDRIAREEEIAELDIPQDTRGPARLYRLRGARGMVGLISPVSREFCQLCNRIRLTADGKLRGCLMADGELDFRAALRNGAGEPEIEGLFLEAMARKPERHYINEEDFVVPGRGMSQIGG